MDRKTTDSKARELMEEPVMIFRRPEPKDETDRMGRELVRRMIEAGVVEPK